MPLLTNYRAFDGLHWATGAARNYLDAVGIKAPHTGQPYSEGMLMGISGGAVMGYFAFAYAGYDPHVVILTRNTFDPLDTLLARMGIVQTVNQSSKPEKGLANLLEALDEGLPAIVWADMYSMPYNNLPADAGMWEMAPIVVFGYETEADKVWIADRARVPLTVTTGELAAARARVKDARYRLMTLDQPDPGKLPAAVLAGIWDCIKLYTEAPPKGSRSNFGLAAFLHWAELLAKPKQKGSWMREFPRGGKLLAGLTSTFNHVMLFGKDGNAERNLFAGFLDEASLVLSKPSLRQVASQFRACGQAWDALAVALLPDDVPALRATRELMVRRHHLFLDRGNAALDEIRAIDGKLRTIKQEVAADFPLDDSGVSELLGTLRRHVLGIYEKEAAAVAALKEAVV